MRVLWFIAIAACAKAPKVGSHKTLATAIAAPHSDTIVEVAVTDEGDAALTADRPGIRIWPRLDGTREPIVVPISDQPRVLALGHDGDGFIGAVLDDVGNVAVLDFDRNGGLLGRVQVGSEVAAIDIAALANTILVLRADSSIVRLDARGSELARVVAPSKTSLQWLATRHGHAIAASTRTIHALEVDRGLAWGHSFKLAIEIVGPIGLSPNARRVSVINASSNRVAIVELASVPRVVAHDKLYPAQQRLTSGFLDNDRLIVPSDAERRWWSWPFVVGPSVAWVKDGFSALAVGDGVAVAAEGGGLAIATAGGRTRYLGYQVLPRGIADRIAWLDERENLISVAFGADESVLRVDDNLHDLGLLDLKSRPGTLDQPTVLDDRYNVIFKWQGWLGNPLPKAHLLVLVDRKRNTTKVVAEYPTEGCCPLPRRSYDPGSRVLGVAKDGTVDRFRFDPKAGTLTRLASLTIRERADLQITDPALAGGIVAVAFDDRHVDSYTDDPEPKSTHARPVGKTLFVDRSGTMYSIDRGALVLTSNGRTTRIRFPIPMPDSRSSVGIGMIQAPMITPSHDTRSIAFVSPTQAAVIDKRGELKWTNALDEPRSARFTHDDRHLLVELAGGIIMLDAETGRVTARACAWRFGLFDTPIAHSSLGTPNVCE